MKKLLYIGIILMFGSCGSIESESSSSTVNADGNERTNLITEAGPGKRFFARNLAKAFNVRLKSFEDLGQFTKFLNREINSVDDMIKHVDDFPGIWKAVASKTDMVALRRNLVKFGKAYDSGKLKGLPPESITNILNGFPVEGGMQEILFDMWRVANGKTTLLPTTISERYQNCGNCPKN